MSCNTIALLFLTFVLCHELAQATSRTALPYYISQCQCRSHESKAQCSLPTAAGRSFAVLRPAGLRIQNVERCLLFLHLQGFPLCRALEMEAKKMPAVQHQALEYTRSLSVAVSSGASVTFTQSSTASSHSFG